MFPHIDDTHTPEFYLNKYPVRKTTAFRLAPSPTGFLHFGGLGTALVNSLLAKKTGGVMFLRIEDTDKKREVVGATEKLVSDLKSFGIKFDEFQGRQSERAEIYHTFAKHLVLNGLAYPCFCHSDQIEKNREIQRAKKEPIGYYGDYAPCSKFTHDHAIQKIQNNEPYCIRFNPAKLQKSAIPTDNNDDARVGSEKITWDDVVRGKSHLPTIVNNPVIIKQGGLPPYNFAHVIDDMLMGTSHVIRGEEWQSSTAEHIMIAMALRETGITRAGTYKYGHLPVIMVTEATTKRKLSKRKDVFALASYFEEMGYPKEAVIEYLLTLYNSDFEIWRLANPDAPVSDFDFRVEKIGTNSPLFDMKKLDHISKNIISKLGKGEVSAMYRNYLAKNPTPTNVLLSKDENFARTERMLHIDRETEKPRKDISNFAQVWDEYNYILDEHFIKEIKPSLTATPHGFTGLIVDYLNTSFKIDDTRSVWFEKMKSFTSSKGLKVGDFAKQLRLYLTGRENTPDLHVILQILGPYQIMKRIV